MQSVEIWPRILQQAKSAKERRGTAMLKNWMTSSGPIYYENHLIKIKITDFRVVQWDLSWVRTTMMYFNAVEVGHKKTSTVSIISKDIDYIQRSLSKWVQCNALTLQENLRHLITEFTITRFYCGAQTQLMTVSAENFISMLKCRS